MKQHMKSLPFAVLVVLLVLGASDASAQRVRASQKGSVMQMVGDTRITVEYSRPVARGRDLFGALVPFGKIWMPGADWASTIEFSEDVTVAGTQVRAGKYSIWTIPGEKEWTYILNDKYRTYHTSYPKGHDAVRFTVTPETGGHMETMAFYFAVVGPDSAVMNLHWGETIVPITIHTN